MSAELDGIWEVTVGNSRGYFNIFNEGTNFMFKLIVTDEEKQKRHGHNFHGVVKKYNKKKGELVLKANMSVSFYGSTDITKKQNKERGKVNFTTKIKYKGDTVEISKRLGWNLDVPLQRKKEEDE